LGACTPSSTMVPTSLPRAPSPATSPADVMTADLSCKDLSSKSEGGEATASLLALATSLLEPIEKLDRLVDFEEARANAEGVESPLLPGLIAAAESFRKALAAHGIDSVTPSAWDDFDGERHEVASLRVRSAAAAHPSAAAVTTSSVIVECHHHGLVHAPSGLVLRRAVVTVRPKPPKPTLPTKLDPVQDSSAGPGSPCAASVTAEHAAEEVGERLHAVQAHDTLQGIALKYHVSPALLVRYNKLPGAADTSLHLRTALLIPPPPVERRIEHRTEHCRPTAATPSDGDDDDDDDDDDGDEAVLFSTSSLGGATFHTRSRRAENVPSRARDASSTSGWTPSLSALASRWTSGRGALGGHQASLGMRPATDTERQASLELQRTRSAPWELRGTGARRGGDTRLVD